MHPTVTSLSCREVRVTSFIRWRVVNRGQCTKPAFLAGHYNARFTGSDVVCVRSCTRGPRAAVHVRALHRKIPGVRKVRFLPAMRKLARFRDFVRSFHFRVAIVTLSAITILANSQNFVEIVRWLRDIPREYTKFHKYAK